MPSALNFSKVPVCEQTSFLISPKVSQPAASNLSLFMASLKMWNDLKCEHATDKSEMNALLNILILFGFVIPYKTNIPVEWLLRLVKIPYELGDHCTRNPMVRCLCGELQLAEHRLRPTYDSKISMWIEVRPDPVRKWLKITIH